MKTKYCNTRRLWKIVLPCLAALLLYQTCTNPLAPKHGAAYFAKIDTTLELSVHMEDSSSYFHAIDSLFDSSPWGLYFKYYNTRGYFFTEKRDYLKAMVYADSTLAAIQGEQNAPGYNFYCAQALLLKGEILVSVNRPKEAFNLYYQAREKILKSKDTSSLFTFNNRLASAAYTQKRYAEALVYYKQAQDELNRYAITNGGNVFASVQAGLDNLGLCYRHVGLRDSAVFYFDSAARYIERNKHLAFPEFALVAKAIVYGNKAQVLIDEGADSMAEWYLKESIRINTAAGVPSATGDIPYNLAKLAGIYIEKRNMQAAMRALGQLKAQLDTMPDPEMIVTLAELQAKYFEAKQDFKTESFFLKRHAALIDSFANVQKQTFSTDIEKEFTALQNENAINSLKKESTLKNLQLFVLMLLLGGCAIVIVLLLIWRNYRLSNKHNAELKDLNGVVRLRNDYLQKALSALETSQEENSRMLQFIAHDLSNPVSAMCTMAQVILGENNATQGDAAKLQMISETGKQALRMIDDILNIKMQAADIAKKPVDLQALLTNNITLLLLKATEKKQQVVLQTEAITVLGDEDKLLRAFSNLIANAIKFSPAQTTIQVHLYREGDDAVFSVADEGIGIPEDMLGKLYTITTEIKRKGTANEPSFGFGLAICKQIIEAHGGHIRVQSVVGKGTTFYLLLPL